MITSYDVGLLDEMAIPEEISSETFSFSADICCKCFCIDPVRF